jgi:putative FmdB family regulatory protein
MPIYEYRCGACKKTEEVMQKMSDPALTVCPACGKGPMEKLISRSTNFTLKGTGWYVTDFKGTKSNQAEAPAPSAAEAPAKASPTKAPSGGGSSD